MTVLGRHLRVDRISPDLSPTHCFSSWHKRLSSVFPVFIHTPSHLPDTIAELGGETLDGSAAIEMNRQALKRILASMIAMAGLAGRLPSPLWGGRTEGPGGGI